MLMLRNLGMRNRRLLRPTRSDQYKAGPSEVSRTSRATTAIGSANTHAAQRPKPRSKTRFKPISAALWGSVLFPDGAPHVVRIAVHDPHNLVRHIGHAVV